jgi:glycosyltransferase involved in cell wall biosynthesis
MNQTSNYYLLIDFNASKRFSHHWDYMDKYKSFLENANVRYEIWIPKNADSEIFMSLGVKTRGVLRSNVYGYERKHNFSQWIIEKIINFILINLVRKLPKYFIEIFKYYSSFFYIYGPYKEIKKMQKRYGKITLVFPTTDSLAIRLLDLCLSKRISIDGASLRTIGVESKDGFSIKRVENKFAELISNYPRCKIILGFETIPYMNILIENGIPKSSIAWAPVPHELNSNLPKSDNQVFTIGFLGTARPNKGFESIPNLVNALTSRGIQFRALAQRAVYPWESYTESLDILLNNFSNVEILPANLSDHQFQKVFSGIDLLVLPYKVENYVVAGSGLLFTAADLHIPTLAKSGVAFSWDINEYNLGFLYTDTYEFVKSIERCMKKLDSFEFSRYNSDRNKHFANFMQTNSLSN